MSTHESRRHEGAGNGPHDSTTPVSPDATLRRLGDALQGLRYGSVLAIVQDGVVVQIERTEKTRFVK